MSDKEYPPGDEVTNMQVTTPKGDTVRIIIELVPGPVPLFIVYTDRYLEDPRPDPENIEATTHEEALVHAAALAVRCLREEATES